MFSDLDISEFITNLFNSEPLPPFSFFIELTDGNMDIKRFLGDILIEGAKRRYNKAIYQLTEDEINKLRYYFHSFGFDAKYKTSINNNTLNIDVTFDKLDSTKYIVDDKILERII